MTLAICVKCGEEKLGALSPCIQCGFDPATPEDKARGLLLCDHNMSVQDLRAVAAEIKSGKIPSFDEDAIEQMAQEIRQIPGLDKLPLGCAIAWYSPILIMIGLALVFVGLLIYVKFIAT
jgi:hypothetical protein